MQWFILRYFEIKPYFKYGFLQFQSSFELIQNKLCQRLQVGCKIYCWIVNLFHTRNQTIQRRFSELGKFYLSLLKNSRIFKAELIDRRCK